MPSQLAPTDSEVKKPNGEPVGGSNVTPSRSSTSQPVGTTTEAVRPPSSSRSTVRTSKTTSLPGGRAAVAAAGSAAGGSVPVVPALVSPNAPSPMERNAPASIIWANASSTPQTDSA